MLCCRWCSYSSVCYMAAWRGGQHDTKQTHAARQVSEYSTGAAGRAGSRDGIAPCLSQQVFVKPTSLLQVCVQPAPHAARQQRQGLRVCSNANPGDTRHAVQLALVGAMKRCRRLLQPRKHSKPGARVAPEEEGWCMTEPTLPLAAA